MTRTNFHACVLTADCLTSAVHLSLSARCPLWLSTMGTGTRPVTVADPRTAGRPERIPALRWADDADPSSTRPATVDLLRHEFAALADLCARSLTEDQWDVATCLPGMDGPRRAQPCHRHRVDAVRRTGSGRRHLPSRPHEESRRRSQRGLGRVDAVTRPATRCSPASTEVTGRRLAALDAMTQADFDAPSWTPAGRDETYGRFMRIRHYDCFMHEHDIRDALGLPPRAEVGDLRSALDEVATGLGYIVGRRAVDARGLTGADRSDRAGRPHLLVQVDGRAAVVDSFDGRRRSASSSRSCSSCG